MELRVLTRLPASGNFSIKERGMAQLIIIGQIISRSHPSVFHIAPLTFVAFPIQGQGLNT